jgi:preprotein translocase subunit SecE
MYEPNNNKKRTIRDLTVAAFVAVVIGFFMLIDWLFALGWF